MHYMRRGARILVCIIFLLLDIQQRLLHCGYYKLFDRVLYLCLLLQWWLLQYKCGHFLHLLCTVCGRDVLKLWGNLLHIVFIRHVLPNWLLFE